MMADSIQIFEDQYYQEAAKHIGNLNTDEQKKRGEFYRLRYMQLWAERQEYEQQWKAIEKLYKCEREEIDGAPNSFIPVLTPNIEGQMASMTDKNIQANIKGKGYSDQKFAHVGQMLTDLFFKENNIKNIIKTDARRYLLFGNAVMAYGWNPQAFGNFGLPEIRCPMTTNVFVDGRIKDMSKLQKAEFIIEEIGFMPILWAKQEYGEDIANALVLMNSAYHFETKLSYDDRYSFKLLHVWTRNNNENNLQLIEMDDRGFILRESDPKVPYYQYVDNKYPFSWVGLYPEEGNFLRFGDGKLLKPIQETINKLYDEIITACKFAAQSRTFVDPQAQCDVDQFDSDPSHPIIAKDPNKTIKAVQGAGINQVVFALLNDLMQQAQRVTRFSDLMIGNNPEKMTATQAGIQTQQGNTGINDKRSDISIGLTEAVEYCLCLAMEFWDAGQAIRISEDKDGFEWVDARELANIPVMVPRDSEYEKKWRKLYPGKSLDEMPQFMQLEKTKGKKKELQTKKVAFDINVSIGEGLPSNKMALYNIILSLAQLVLPDEQTGQMRPIMGYQQVRKMIEDLVGLPLDDALEQAKKYGTPPVMPQGNVNPVNVNPNIPGANMNGNMGGGSLAV